MNKRLLITIVIVVAAVILAIILDTVLSNHRPVIIGLEATPEKVSPSGTCQIVCTASDADDDELSYDWSVNGGEIDGVGYNVTWTAPSSVGSYNVTVIITDGHGGEATNYLIIEVRTNKAPTITGLVADAEWTLPAGNIQLICIASDADGDELSYEWSTSGGVISDMGSEVTWIAPENTGMYDITVVVKDSHGAENTRLIKLSVATGAPPVIEDLIVTADHKYLKENGSGYDYKVGKEQNYDIKCTVSDPGVGVSYNWSCEDGEISGISEDGSTITWTAPNITNAYFTVTVIVSDVADNSVSKSVVLYVVSCSTCTFG